MKRLISVVAIESALISAKGGGPGKGHSKHHDGNHTGDELGGKKYDHKKHDDGNQTKMHAGNMTKHHDDHKKHDGGDNTKMHDGNMTKHHGKHDDHHDGNKTKMHDGNMTKHHGKHDEHHKKDDQVHDDLWDTDPELWASMTDDEKNAWKEANPDHGGKKKGHHGPKHHKMGKKEWDDHMQKKKGEHDKHKKSAKDKAKKCKKLKNGEEEEPPKMPVEEVEQDVAVMAVQMRLGRNAAVALATNPDKCTKVMKNSYAKSGGKGAIQKVSCSTTDAGRRLAASDDLSVSYVMISDDKAKLAEEVKSQNFITNLKETAKTENIDVSDPTVGNVDVKDEKMRFTYQFTMKDWSTPTNDWLQTCNCAEVRSRTAVCNKYDGTTLVESVSDDKCPGSKPTMTQTCPCPDSKNVEYKFEQPQWNVSYSEWVKTCDCDDVRENTLVCSKYQNNVMIQQGVEDASVCYFSMEMSEENYTIPETSQKCPESSCSTQVVASTNDESASSLKLVETSVSASHKIVAAFAAVVGLGLLF